MSKSQPHLIIQPRQIYQTECQVKSRTGSHNFLRINKMYNTFITSSISNVMSRS